MKNILAFFLILVSSHVFSEILKLNHLNAYYLSHDVKSESVFIILHGTRGHKNLEIISMLRESLHDNGFDSISINLSYGIKNREDDFLPCDIDHKHLVSDSLNEIKGWYDHSKKLGYKKIHLIGHSRGGLDIINFYEQLNKSDKAIIDLIFLLAPSSDNNQDHVKTYMEKYQIDIKNIKDNDIIRINFLGCENAKVHGNSFKSYYHNLDTISTIDSLKIIRANTHVITASDDNIVPLTHEKVERSSNMNENVKLYSIDGADHFFRDLYFDDLLEIILDKLD
tara:strand:+ start:20 stop:862 length:843 start_codon:yes stop_codon:yes gene_type:complete